MRMWMVSPSILCDIHLRGEHVECHMFISCIKLGKKLDGYVRNNCLHFKLLTQRHNDLAEEMIKRNMRHASPMDDINTISHKYSNYIINSVVDYRTSYVDLFRRCVRCRKLAVMLVNK